MERNTIKKEAKLILITLILSLIMIQSVTANWQQTAEEVVVNVDIGSTIKIIPEKEDYEIKSMVAELELFPREKEWQIAKSMNVDNEKEKILFEWENPTETEIQFSVKGKVNIKRGIKKIKEKEEFPIKEIPEEIKKYLEETEKIDYNFGKIKEKANEIAGGETDLFVVSYKIAKWIIDEIDYDLNTLTAEGTNKASWTMNNKYGVCDEISTLFIAMMRSLGVPARYITGYAYTNYNDLNDFGSHAWAEVYYPTEGWVPYDVTYEEIGYIDVGHLTLRESISATGDVMRFEAVGRNIKIDSEELTVKIDIEEKIGKEKPDIEIKLEYEEKEIGFGSYNLITGKITNLKDYYLVLPVYISETENIETISQKEQYVLLKPGETKNLYWTIKVEEELEEKYIYTFPLKIYTQTGIEKDIEIKSKKNKKIISLEEINEIIVDQTKEEEKVYSKKIDLDCKSEEEWKYEEEKIMINCKIKNEGNVMLEEINLCIKESIDDCKKINLGIGEEKEAVFETKIDQKGIKVKAESADISKTQKIEIEVKDYPKIEIEEVNFPNKVKYEEEFKIEFKINKMSDSNPTNIKINVKEYMKEMTIKELKDAQRISLNLKGKDLIEGNNTLKIIVEYKDLREKEYQEIEEINIELEKLNLIQKMISWMNKFNRKIGSMIQ